MNPINIDYQSFNVRIEKSSNTTIKLTFSTSDKNIEFKKFTCKLVKSDITSIINQIGKNKDFTFDLALQNNCKVIIYKNFDLAIFRFNSSIFDKNFDFGIDKENLISIEKTLK